MGLSTRIPIDVGDVSGTQWALGEISASELFLKETHRASSPASFPPLRHLTFVFVVEGVVQTVVDGALFVLVAGSAAVVPSNHVPQFTSDASRVLLVSVAGRSAEEFDGFGFRRPVSLSASVIRNHPALPYLLSLIQKARTQAVQIHPSARIVTDLLVSLLCADHYWQARPQGRMYQTA